MNALARAVCLFRRHRWEQHSDPAGTVMFCSRCGKLRHSGGSISLDSKGPLEGGE